MNEFTTLEQYSIGNLENLLLELNKYYESRNGIFPRTQNKEHCDLLNSVLYLHENYHRDCMRGIVEPGEERDLIEKLASIAIEQLGTVQPALVSLKDYRADIYGPFLGISDEGGFVDIVRQASFQSPKSVVNGDGNIFVTGIAIDAERLGAVGELAVGPAEYQQIHLGRIGYLFATTNVGTRVNLRYLKQRPIITVPTGTRNFVLYQVIKAIASTFKPFYKTPNRIPLDLTVFLRFDGPINPERWLYILRDVEEKMKEKKFCDPSHHRIGLHIEVGSARRGFEKVIKAMDIARMAGIAEVSVHGKVRREAHASISLPSLLDYFNDEYSSKLLHYAQEKHIKLEPLNIVDTDTVARNIATSLGYVRGMGFELGRYGLLPLTLSESKVVMGMIQEWYSNWSAAPALYVDMPLVDHDHVYSEIDIKKGIYRWLDIAAAYRISLVLLDTADKSKNRRILKDDPTDTVGILTLEDISDLERYSRSIGVRIIWAGGITLPQVYEFGKLGVFGIFVTSSVSVKRPIRGPYNRDVMLSHSTEPTIQGIYTANLLLQAGFMVRKYNENGMLSGETISLSTRKLIDSLTNMNMTDDERFGVQEELSFLLKQGWQILLK